MGKGGWHSEGTHGVGRGLGKIWGEYFFYQRCNMILSESSLSNSNLHPDKHLCTCTHTHTQTHTRTSIHKYTVPLWLKINIKLFYSRNQGFSITPKEVTSCNFPPCGATGLGRRDSNLRRQNASGPGDTEVMFSLPPPTAPHPCHMAGYTCSENELPHRTHPLGSPLKLQTLQPTEGVSGPTSKSISRWRENFEKPAGLLAFTVRSSGLNSSTDSPGSTTRVNHKPPPWPSV